MVFKVSAVNRNRNRKTKDYICFTKKAALRKVRKMFLDKNYKNVKVVEAQAI